MATTEAPRLSNAQKRAALIAEGKSYLEIENAYRLAKFPPHKIMPTYKKVNQEEIRLGQIRRKYGLTRVGYKSWLEKQNNACAICKRNFFVNDKCRVLVDHDHITGKVRGLLCNNCNTALGMIKDDPAIAQAMIDYLNKFRG